MSFWEALAVFGLIVNLTVVFGRLYLRDVQKKRLYRERLRVCQIEEDYVAVLEMIEDARVADEPVWREFEAQRQLRINNMQREEDRQVFWQTQAIRDSLKPKDNGYDGGTLPHPPSCVCGVCKTRRRNRFYSYGAMYGI